ncbi:GTPase EngC [Candidatus Phytoplasma mali]|uniref:Small ribosomal subunit biogenesis GTPase RsgA n=1 Tax=Phytoplasma mali (strain AT) TaxID=482235 RepID=RSGA_PHYMT|nr:ribosome small subunit-dependent GTPase A [Candidatus Phytoplasma mali]B3R0A1.1 RecName: Full=Small ribosomal subunit biogenesis GTPase RsgA [Candidatus Phytoplasma mali AT]CAP18265.1 GTPase EngC [Candidatus Phytoplasma mali]
MKKALVIKFFMGNYLISDIETKDKITAQVKGKLKNYDTHKKELFIIKVGDIVIYENYLDRYLISEVLERHNELNRPNIANFNQVILVFSLYKPRFQFRLLDKFLLILNKYKLKIILIFTKIDLITKKKFLIIQKKISYYENFYRIYYVNSKNKNSTHHLMDIFSNKITVLAGQTGVGKSTFLNSLKPSLQLKTQEISKKLGLGKHTTKNAQLYEFNGGYIADTPGFSKLDLTIFDYEELKFFYPDFLLYSDKCYFKKDCSHIKEINCGVKKALKLSLIPDWRYDNYLKFIEKIQEQKKLNYNKK